MSDTTGTKRARDEEEKEPKAPTPAAPKAPPDEEDDDELDMPLGQLVKKKPPAAVASKAGAGSGTQGIAQAKQDSSKKEPRGKPQAKVGWFWTMSFLRALSN
jgi:hypothetical protein